MAKLCFKGFRWVMLCGKLLPDAREFNCSGPVITSPPGIAPSQFTKEHWQEDPNMQSLIPHSHYSRECASVRIDAHSRIRTIHTTATMRSEAHSMSKRSEAKRSEANSRIRLLYPNSRIRFASLRYLALVWKVPKRSEAHYDGESCQPLKQPRCNVCVQWVSDGSYI